MVATELIREQPTHRDRVKIVADNIGESEATTARVLELIERAGVKITRQTVSKYLNQIKKADTEAAVDDKAPETASAAPEPVGTPGDTPQSEATPQDDTRAVRPRLHGQALAYLTLIFGILLSAGANVAHAAWVVPAHTGEDPNLWAIGSAAVWPVLLFLALEIMTQVRWQLGRSKLVRVLSTSVIAVVAAVVSYSHASALLVFWGESPVAAYVGPVAIDGLVAIAALALANNRGLRE
jgi:ribosomal protein L12E/L44/L45/RPP1/RPP2